MPIQLSDLTSRIPSATKDGLSDFWNNYKPQIMGGLAGAGIGAAGLGGAAALSDEADPEQKSQNVKQNLLLGGVLGGLGGVGGGAAYKMYNAPSSQGFLSRAFNFLKGSRPVAGAAGAVGLNAGLRRSVNKGFNLKGTGGEFAGKNIDDMSKDLAERVKNFTPGQSAEQSIRDVVERMTANKSTTGRLSQNPIFRYLGLNTVDPRAETQVLQALRPMMDSTEGQVALQRILGAQPGENGAQRALPFLQKALLGGPAAEESLRRSHTLSALGRLGTGASLYSGVRMLDDLFSKNKNEGMFPQMTR